MVTPTISLIHDQTSELTQKGINAVILGSAQHHPEATEKPLDVADPALEHLQ